MSKKLFVVTTEYHEETTEIITITEDIKTAVKSFDELKEKLVDYYVYPSTLEEVENSIEYFGNEDNLPLQVKLYENWITITEHELV